MLMLEYSLIGTLSKITKIGALVFDRDDVLSTFSSLIVLVGLVVDDVS